MSHEATNWAVKQRGISPAAKLVLWQLADRHHPDHGCFPSQERLAADCEMSRSSVNNQLRALEDAGLIKRFKRFDEATNRQKSTRYILRFEDCWPHDLDGRVQDLDTGAVSKYETKPCPNMKQSRVQNLDTNPVRGTSKKEPVDQSETDPCITFSEFWDRWPLKKVGKKKAEHSFKRLSQQKRRAAIESVQGWAKVWRLQNPTATDLHPTTYLNGERWEDDYGSAAVKGSPSKRSRWQGLAAQPDNQPPAYQRDLLAGVPKEFGGSG